MKFGDRLAAAVRRAGNPVVVGLDPRWNDLPDVVKSAHSSGDPATRAAAYASFCRGVIDVVARRVPAVKPQVAFFEQLGPPGMQALAETIEHARRSGLLVVVDGKRNDIGSTAEAYADAWIGEESCWRGDALTVNPYLGADSLEPFVAAAARRDCGVFVLVKTSNPGGGQFQDLVADGRPIYLQVAAHVESLASSGCGASRYGAVGAVVGATYPDQLHELRTIMPHAWLLVPGYGSQGGTARDVAGAFDEQGLGAVINNARGIIFAHRRPEYSSRYAADRWQDMVAAATDDMIAELRSDTPADRLVSAAV
jgi:orotidine-5'-phosphate decarboxylase